LANDSKTQCRFLAGQNAVLILPITVAIDMMAHAGR
jgi:hypothetical protein